MGLLNRLTEPKARDRLVEDRQSEDVSIDFLFVYLKHANGPQNQLPAAGKKPLGMFKGKFKRAFMSQRKRPVILERCIDLDTSKEVCNLPCITGSDTDLNANQQWDKVDGVADTTDLVAPLYGASASGAEPLMIAELQEVQHIVQSDPGFDTGPTGLPRDTPDLQTSELSASPVKENEGVTAGISTLRRMKSQQTLPPSKNQLYAPEGQGLRQDLDKLTSQLISQHLEDTELFPSSPSITSPNTPSSPTSEAESRPDSGVGQSPTAEAQRWKRAYDVQKDATYAAEKALEEARKTQVSELSDKQEQLSTVVSMHQALYAQHEELKAQKAGSSAHSAPKIVPKAVSSSDEAVLLKSRLEQSDRDLTKAKAANQALETELTNTRHVNCVGAKEFAELNIAWQHEIGRNKELSAQGDSQAVSGLAEYKALYEKECMKNIQLRLAMENDPKKTAEMDRTIDHLQKELLQSQKTNNEQVAALNQIEKRSKYEQTIAEAQVKAAASQNEMLADVAHEFCKRKTTFQSATNTLVADLLECDNHRDIATAVDRYCDTVTYEKQLESLIKKGAAQLTEAHGTIGQLEVQIHEQQTEIEDQKLNHGALDLKCRSLENKITVLEVDATHRAGDLTQATTAKDSKIQQLQSQLVQIETQLRSGLDACIQWFLSSKDQEIATQKAHLASANQEIHNLKVELHTKTVFTKLDSEHHQNYFTNLETYPPRLAAAEEELETLRSKISTFESQSSILHDNCVDLKAHSIRVSEVRAQTRAQVADEVRAEVGSRIKNETEQLALRQWIRPLQELGSFLWARMVRLEGTLVGGGVDVRDRERWVLEGQSRRLRVVGWEGVGDVGGMVSQRQGQRVGQGQGRRQGPCILEGRRYGKAGKAFPGIGAGRE